MVTIFTRVAGILLLAPVAAALGQAPGAPGGLGTPAVAPVAPAPGMPATPAGSQAPAVTLPPGTQLGLPPITVDPPILDLGFMAPKAGGKGAFKLTNSSGQPLKIVAVTPSCKCTTTSALAGSVLAPGQTVSLEAVLEGVSMPQTHRASIRVAVEGYSQPLELVLRGETARAIRAVPPILNAVAGKPRQGRFVIESLDKKPFRICAISGRAPEYIGYASGDAPRNTYLVRFDLDTWQPTFPAYFVVETDREECPVFDVWVRNEATLPQPGFRMKEYRVNAGRIDLGGTGQVTVEMDDPGEDILAVESGSPDVRIDLVGQKGDGTLRSIILNVVPTGPKPGLLYAPFKMYGREKEQALILFATVRPKGANDCDGCPAESPATAAPAAPAATSAPATPTTTP
jgi:hypothetical protein